MDRGFITIATGADDYYRVARNLLRSYRAVAKCPLPFAILTDRQNEYTYEFDDVILLEGRAANSYLDKLELANYIPYNETVFIDADSLCLADPNKVFDDFSDCGDVSFYGCLLPLNSENGWFKYDKCGKYRERIKFNLDGHGGLYYLKKSEKCKEIFALSKELAKEWDAYGFKYFDNPADEPVIALAMAINGCRPCEKDSQILFLPSYRGRISVDFNGAISIDGKKQEAVILHFAMSNTKLFIYQWLKELLIYLNEGSDLKAKRNRYIWLKFKLIPRSITEILWHSGGHILRTCVPERAIRTIKKSLLNY